MSEYRKDPFFWRGTWDEFNAIVRERLAPPPGPRTGYGPTADAIRDEVDADNAKDTEILRLKAELAGMRAELERRNGALFEISRYAGRLSDYADTLDDHDEAVQLRGIAGDVQKLVTP